MSKVSSTFVLNIIYSYMVLLSFDTEEFDVPREHGVDFSLDDGMKVSVFGTNRILDCLEENGVKATFFCTGKFRGTWLRKSYVA